MATITNTTGSNASWATEYFLYSASTTVTYQTTQGILHVFINLSNLAAGDQYEIKIYEKVNGTVGLVRDTPVVRSGAQSGHFDLMVGVVKEGYEVSIKNLAGTSTRTITWALRLVAPS